MKWKDRLLSSSIPLEYEVARILARNKFSVNFDYSYKRLDTNLEKEFSIDIKASGYYPFPMNSPIKLEIDLLVECKYRNPNVSWLFIEDLNIPEYSSSSSKGVVKFIDEFSEYISNQYISSFPICNTCLKGIEVNIQNGEVHDTGITHGINQLVYGIPPILRRKIVDSLACHLEDNHPYIICPILVTTANLRQLDSNFSIDSLAKAQSLEDISTEVPYIRLYSDIYPSFEEHCRNTFKDTLEYDRENMFDYFIELRKNNYNQISKGKLKNFRSSPEFLLTNLQNGFGNDVFRETLICNFNHFPTLIKELKKEISFLGRNLRKLKSQQQ